MTGLCCHCRQPAEAGWSVDELAVMLADNAYPPSTCNRCWTKVQTIYLDSPCLGEPCPHLAEVTDGPTP